jgi:hypothetical protein
MRAMPLPACLAALVLLMDSSGSVSEAHFRAQREGTAAAFEHHDVVAGLEASDGIAVMVVDFAQVPTTRLPWTMVRTAEEGRRFAEALRATGRLGHPLSTAIGDALLHAGAALREAPCEPERRVIDISTDGYETAGHVAAAQARALVADQGATINAIAFSSIDDPETTPEDPATLAGIEDWLREHVVTGFLRSSTAPGAYADAFRAKLTTEIALRIPALPGG